MLKTHNCGELRLSHAGQKVVLAGWLHKRRDHGGLIFLDLRDRSGLVQVTVEPATGDAHAVAEKSRSEFVLKIEGNIRPRPEALINPNLATGEIEVVAQSIEILNPAKAPPIPIDDEGYKTEESQRLKYRYLDLRRSRLQNNLMLRHKTIKFIRDYLDQRGFIEIETPMMIKSTPEGARDYVVPSRLQQGKFFALPQSPQQLKQLLMVAGYERYFQIARCMRDEDLRGDRQPEFTQLDLEMSFVEREDVLAVVEGLVTELIPAVTPHKRIFTPFPRFLIPNQWRVLERTSPTCASASRSSMRPMRFGDRSSRRFPTRSRAEGSSKPLAAPGCAGYSRREIDILTEVVKAAGARGMATLAWAAEGVKGSAAKFLNETEINEVRRRFEAREGDLICLVADKDPVALKALGNLRL